MMISKGFVKTAIHKGMSENFNRKIDDGQDVIITIATRTSNNVQDTNPLNPGFTVTETSRTVRVIARYMASLRGRGGVTTPYEEKILTRLGMDLEGDLIIVGKYVDYEDFRNCVELSYVGKRYVLYRIQPGYYIGDNVPYLFAATFNLKERSTN